MPVTTDFVTLDRFDESTRAGVEISYLHEDEDIARIEAYAQYADPVRHLGVYLDMPVAYGRGDAILGDVAAGAMFMIDTGESSGVMIHTGVVMPSVGAGDDDLALAAMIDRPHMAYQAFDSFSARLSMSPVFRQGAFFGRIDLGIDLPLGAEQLRTMFHGGLGAGYDFTTGTVGAEVQLIRLFDASSSKNQALIDGAVSARLRFDQIEPYVAVALPIDDESRGAYDISLTVGVAAKLR